MSDNPWAQARKQAEARQLEQEARQKKIRENLKRSRYENDETDSNDSEERFTQLHFIGLIYIYINLM